MYEMFGFNHIPSKTFNKNFLKAVIFQFSFENNLLIESNKEKIKDIFKASFPRQSLLPSNGVQISFVESRGPVVHQIDEKKGLELKSSDGQKVIKIDNTSFSMTISGKVYKNYVELKSEVEPLINEFLSICQIDKIAQLSIRKINIIEFKVENNPCDVLGLLINSDLIGNLNHFPNSNWISQNIQSLNYRNDNNFLNVKYGLNLLHNMDEIGQIIVDIELIKRSAILVGSIFEISSEINTEIFNVFNWVVSNQTLNLLDE